MTTEYRRKISRCKVEIKSTDTTYAIWVQSYDGEWHRMEHGPIDKADYDYLELLANNYLCDALDAEEAWENRLWRN